MKNNPNKKKINILHTQKYHHRSTPQKKKKKKSPMVNSLYSTLLFLHWAIVDCSFTNN